MTTGTDASPQVGRGHGHTEVSNELLEAIYRHPWRTAVGLRVVLWIMRDSYGWKRKETRALSFPEIGAIIEADRVSTFKAFRALLRQNVVLRGPAGGWVLVKNYRAWGATPDLPGLSTPVDNPVDKSLPTGNGCLQATDSRCPQATKTMVSGNGPLPTGNAYKEKERERKKERGAGRALPQLPNGKFDSPRHRAELGHPDFAPEEHVEFKRLSFKLQDALVEEWKEAKAKHACRTCGERPRASAAWPYCRPCTVCHVCKAPADGTTNFVRGPDGVVCTSCSTETKAEKERGVNKS